MDKFILQPGKYYVGDIGYALSEDYPFDIKNFSDIQSGEYQTNDGRKFWLTKTNNLMGTLYSNDGYVWGFDFGVFGCMLMDEITSKSSYRTNEIEFSSPFEFSFTDNTITIGHLIFTYELPENVELKGLHIPELRDEF